MTFLHVMRQIALLLCHISSTLKSRSFGTLICVLISFWILSFLQQDSSGLLPPYILESFHPISISDTEAVSET